MRITNGGYVTEEVLRTCAPTARWMFERITPLMEKGPLYGYLHYAECEIGSMFGVSQPTISNALWELHRAGLMRKARTGTWYCPAMISALLVRVKA